MKLLAVLAVAVGSISLAGGQQLPPPTQPSGTPSSSPQILFERSQDPLAVPPSADSRSKDTQDTQSSTSTQMQPLQLPGGPVTDAEREGITFLSYDLDVHLQPTQQAVAVRARMELRNDGPRPLSRLPLQISATLAWRSIRIDGKAASFVQQPIDSDVDHTGALHEAVIQLPEPLASKQTLVADVTYEGMLGPSTLRLERIDTPPDVAGRSDWDRVASDFVGVRGFGNVIWYPVVSVPVLLGDGDKFFAEVANQRMRQSGASISMKVTEEFSGAAPNLAVLDGIVSTLEPQTLPTATLPGIVQASLPKTQLGFVPPSLFMLTRSESRADGLRFFTRPENTANTQAYTAAANMVASLLTQWLGKKTRSDLTIIDLADAGDASFESGPVLFTPVESVEPDQIAGVLVHSLTHAHFSSPYPWLQEGVAYFMATLWVEQKSGHDAAIALLDNSRGALSLVEPANLPLEGAGSDRPGAPGLADSGESLLAARDAVYYRTKATYVLWMLRNLAGDDALGEALRGYDPATDTDGTELETSLERITKKDLKWFFADWVYRDRGLPDLSIAGVHPNTSNLPGSYIVAVDVSNSGNAEAEVPVSVRSASVTVTERLRIPAKSSITHRFLLAGQPQEVAVNDGTVPEAEASVHKKSLDTGGTVEP